MAERLGFSDCARLPRREVEAMEACLEHLLGPVPRRASVLASALTRLVEPASLVLIRREECLDLCAELLELASSARHQGRDVEAYALEGVECRLLDALIAPSAF